MSIQSASDIYNVLEQVLRKAVEPLTCVALMEISSVREAALAEFGGDVQHATNKLSDTLGFMWRRDVIDRYPAPRGSGVKARYAYAWPKDVAKPELSPLPSSTSKKASLHDHRVRA